MATKAELFRYLSERSGAKRPKQAKRKAGPAEPKRHNLSLRTDRHAGYTYEEAAAGKRPSRKSTRKSENRQRGDGAKAARRAGARALGSTHSDAGFPSGARAAGSLRSRPMSRGPWRA
jgi:hypothetical protein